MDIETAKTLVGAALVVAVAAFSVVTLSAAVVAMLRDLRLLPPRVTGAAHGRPLWKHVRNGGNSPLTGTSHL